MLHALLWRLSKLIIHNLFLFSRKFKGSFKQYILFGLAVTLVVLLVLVTAYNGWEEFSQAEKKLKADDVDFVMYGPVRTELGQLSSSSYFYLFLLELIQF